MKLKAQFENLWAICGLSPNRAIKPYQLNRILISWPVLQIRSAFSTSSINAFSYRTKKNILLKNWQKWTKFLFIHKLLWIAVFGTKNQDPYPKKRSVPGRIRISNTGRGPVPLTGRLTRGSCANSFIILDVLISLGKRFTNWQQIKFVPRGRADTNTRVCRTFSNLLTATKRDLFREILHRKTNSSSKSLLYK